MGTYLPFPATHRDELGLWTRTANWLKSKKIHKDPHHFIKDILTGKANRHVGKKEGNYTIACGDFNHRWDVGRYKLKEWVEENNWACPSIVQAKEAQAEVATFYRKDTGVSWIDHHLIAPEEASSSVLTTTTYTGGFWEEFSDHRPIQIGLAVPGGRGKSGIALKSICTRKPPPGLVELQRKDAEMVMKYQESMEKSRHQFSVPLDDLEAGE